MILAIDFNGVLCDRSTHVQGKRLGPPIKGAQDAMRELKSYGHTLHVYTDMASTTKGYQAVQDWLEYFNVPWDYITNVKPPGASFFVDDKAITFLSWEQTLAAIMAK